MEKNQKKQKKVDKISGKSITCSKPEYTEMFFDSSKIAQYSGKFGAAVTKQTKKQKNRSPITTLPYQIMQKSTLFSHLRPQKPSNQKWQISLKQKKTHEHLA